MRLLLIEPTPNPNSMRLTLDQSLPAGTKLTYSPRHRENYTGWIRQIVSVSGVESVFHAADFMAIQRQPGADWEKILSRVRHIFDGGADVKINDAGGQQMENWGEVEVSIQFFRQLPMLVRVRAGQEEKRVALPARFQQAVQQASRASANMLMERKWRTQPPRYGALEEVGGTTAEEIDAAYPPVRLERLVERILTGQEDAPEHFVKGENLSAMLESGDWRERFAALSRLGAKAEHLEHLIAMTRDPKMNIRRLAVVYLGLIGTKAVLKPVCDALDDESVAVRRTAGDALTDLGLPEAMGPMARTLKDPNKLVRWRAARFMYEHGDETMLPLLKSLQEDPEFEVRMQVRQAIERIEKGEKAQGTVWQQMTARHDD